MANFFNGKRIIDLEDYERMTEEQKKEVEKVISNSEIIEIQGEYREIKPADNKESFIVSVEILKRIAEKDVYERRMRDLIQKIKDGDVLDNDYAIEFYTYSEGECFTREQISGYLDEIKNSLEKSDFERFMYLLVLMIEQHKGETKQSKIDVQQHISYGIVYYTTIVDLQQSIVDKNEDSSNSLRTIRDSIRQEFGKIVDAKGGIIQYTQDRIDVREKELIIDLILEKIASTDVDERDEYVRILQKIKLNDIYLTELLNLGVLSDNEIMIFYRTDWLGNKIESAIQKLKQEDRIKLEKRLENQINEWVNFYAGVIAHEETNDDQFKRNIDNLPPKIKKRVEDRIKEVKKQIEQSKRGQQRTGTSGEEEISLETLLRNILSTEGEKKEEYIKSLKRRKIKAEDIVKLVQQKKISYEDLDNLYKIKTCRHIISKVIAGLHFTSVVKVYMVSRNIYILDNINWDDINTGKLRRCVDSILEPDITPLAVAEIIVRMHQLGKMKMTDLDISSIFDYVTNIDERIRVYFELVKNGVYTEDVIIEEWNYKVNESNMEEPYQQHTEETVGVEELLQFFDADKVLAKMAQYYEPESKKGKKKELITYDIGIEEFLAFYRGLLEANRITNQEETQQIIAELEAKLSGKILEGLDNGEMKYLLVAIELLDKKVITTENMREILSEENQEKLLEMYEKGLDDRTLLSLYKKGLAQDYILELIYQDIEKEKWLEKRQNNSIGIEDIMILCALGILDKKNIKGMKFEDVDWESLSTFLDETKLKKLIELLYLNQNIGFEEIKQLKEMGVLSAKEAEALTNQIDLEEILKKGLTSEEGVGVKGRTKIKEGNKKREENGLPDREVFLGDLGFRPITDKRGNVLVVAEGSFKGYKIYMSSEYQVILLEKDIQASTFAMHKAKAGEFFREEAERTTLVGSRSDWGEKSRTDGSVILRKHTLNWGSNIIGTIVDIDSTFRFDDETERVEYVKGETKRLYEKNKDSIEYLRMAKEEFYAKK